MQVDLHPAVLHPAVCSQEAFKRRASVWPLRQRNGGAIVMMVRWESFFHHCSLEILMHVSTVTFQIKVKHMISRESEVQ